MATEQEELLRQSDELYDRYAVPFEKEHWGKFIAVSPRGETMIGDDMDELAWRALEAFGPGGWEFKLGERAVGRIR